MSVGFWAVAGAFALGALVAAVVALIARQRLVAELASTKATLDTTARTAEEHKRSLEAAQAQLRDSFASLSHEALKDNRDDFIRNAGQLLQPVRETLARVQQQLADVDKQREGSYRDVVARLGSLDTAQRELREATAGLSRSLRSPNVRGKWGEVQLHRIVDLSGMIEHCDFTLQAGAPTEDSRVRPDLVIHLPGGSHVVLDAKVPIDAYMRAAEATDDGARARALEEHAAQVKAHVRALGSKRYWQAFDPAPEFVIMFLPLEPLLSAAFERDAELLEFSAREHVVLTTPMTLLALLRAVAYGWQQHAIARNTEAIQEAGRELCERLVKLVEHFDKVGQSVGQAMRAYNEAVASFNTRVMPSVKRFQELKVPSAAQIEAPATRDVELREITKPSLPGLDPDEPGSADPQPDDAERETLAGRAT